MVRHFTTEQRAWIVARKLQGDTLATIQAFLIQFDVHVCEYEYCRLTTPTFGL